MGGKNPSQSAACWRTGPGAFLWDSLYLESNRIFSSFFSPFFWLVTQICLDTVLWRQRETCISHWLAPFQNIYTSCVYIHIYCVCTESNSGPFVDGVACTKRNEFFYHCSECLNSNSVRLFLAHFICEKSRFHVVRYRKCFTAILSSVSWKDSQADRERV